MRNLLILAVAALYLLRPEIAIGEYVKNCSYVVDNIPMKEIPDLRGLEYAIVINSVQGPVPIISKNGLVIGWQTGTTGYDVIVSRPDGSKSNLSNLKNSDRSKVIDLLLNNCNNLPPQLFPPLSPPGSAAAQSSLSNSSPSFGQASEDQIVADFNGDGNPDIVDLRSGAVVAQILNADLTVLSSKQYAAGINPYFGLAGDFNGDGKLDLAISNNGNSQGNGSGVSILLGNGDGTFQAAKNFAINGNSFGIAAADFNGDGKLDVAVTDDQLGLIWVLLGNGDGSLQSPVSYSSGAPPPLLLNSPLSILAADFNNDGKADLATLNSGVNTISVLLGKGDGTFQAAELSSGGSGIGSNGYLTYADFNHDGILDLAIAYQASNSISLLLGNGDGMFHPARNFATGNYPGSMTVIPTDDGSAALFTLDKLTGNLIVEFSRGDGRLSGHPLYSVSQFLASVTAADLNGDRIPDVITYDPGSFGVGAVDVMLAGSDGSLQSPVKYPLPNFAGVGSHPPQALATGDLNGDGKPDVVAVTGGSTGYLDVLVGVGDGTLAAPQAFAAGSHPTAVVLADFNGDGKLDSAVGNTGTSGNSGDPGGVSILLGNGDGTFQAPANYSTGPLNLVYLAAADFNGDGKPDLAVVTRTLFNTSPIVPSSIVILLNNGNGTFRTGSTLQIDSTIQATAVTVGDLNGDGKADLAVAAFEEQGPGDGVAIFLGNGDGTFSAGTFVTTGEPGPVNLAIIDLDRDGKADLVVNFCCGLADSTYLLGNGDGTFQAEQHILSGSSPVGLAVTDFNADGLPDLVFATQGGSVVTWKTFLPLVSGSCSYYIDFSSASFPVSGGGLTIGVSTTPACGWTVSGLPPWITTSNAVTGSGTATIPFTVAPNSGGPRSATVNVSGRLITVAQAAAGCGYGLSLGGQAFSATGGAGSLSVTANPGCGWTATGAPAWVTFTGGSAGTGNGVVNFTVAANAGADRTATLTIAGIAYTIQQESASISGLNFIGSMPHLAGEENWTTSFTLVNKSGAPATARLSFFGDDNAYVLDPNGSGPLSLPLALPQQLAAAGPLLAASFDQTLAANASLIAITAGLQTQPLQVGSAQLSATGAVDGFAIFHQIVTQQEAVVPLETRNAGSYLLPFDNTNGLVLGVALANLSAQSATVHVVIRDDTGTQIATGSLPQMAAGDHYQFGLAAQFPITANKRGTIEFDTPVGGRISVLGLRFTPPNNALTTIPALANVGTGGGSIAHLASGGDGWQTTFVLVNTGTSAAQATLNFYADQTGASMLLPLTFPQGNIPDATASFVTQTLPPGATLLIVSSGAPNLLTGSAQLSTNGNVSGFVIFRHNGQEAVVPLEGRNAGGYIIAFDNTSGTFTGVALNAVSAQAVNIPVTVRDDTGATIATDTIAMAANGHYAFTLGSDRYPSALTIRGTIEFDTPAGAQIGALGIRIPTGAAHTYTTLPALAK